MSKLNHYGKKVNEIFQTSDYAKFQAHKLNREIRQSHVNELYNDMITNGWLDSSEITVTENGRVIDGHHRLLAAQKAGIPFHYKISRGVNQNVAIRRANRFAKNWAITDHIHGYVVEGNQHYINLENFMKEYPDLKPTECQMLTQNGYVSIVRKTMDSGSFKTKDMNLARKWADYIMSLKPYFSGYNRAIFVRALIKILSRKPEFKFEQFLKKLQNRPASIYPCGTTDQYVELIEKIYNMNRRTDDRINLRF